MLLCNEIPIYICLIIDIVENNGINCIDQRNNEIYRILCTCSINRVLALIHQIKVCFMCNGITPLYNQLKLFLEYLS